MGFKQGDVEQDYERRPRASKEDGPAAGRELLPVREGGKWQRRTAPAPKGEPQTKKGKQRAKARAQASAAAAAGSAPAAELSLSQKRATIAKLSAQLLHSPHKNIGLLKELHELASRDVSPATRRMAALSCVAVLRDLIPAYRIRLPTDKELAMQVSSEVEALRAYERQLLRGHEAAVGLLRGWLRGGEQQQRLAAVRGLAALLEKGRDFNGVDQLIGGLVPSCNSADDEERAVACGALTELFGADVAGEATLLAVRSMAALLKTSSFSVHPSMLECWLSLRLDASAAAAAASAEKERFGARKGKKRRRGIDPVARELAAASGDRGDVGLKSAAVLEQLFVSYARVVKARPGGPLMPLVLRGIAKFAHCVNVELLLDLVSNLRTILRDPAALSTPAALHCVHALLRLLSGHGAALAVDMRDVQQRLYSLLAEQALLADTRLLATALDCLDHLCRQRSALLAPRIASFFCRLVDAAATLPHAHAVALLAAASRLLVACPRVTALLDGTDRAGPPLAPARADELEDVDSPRAINSTAWQLALLHRHYHPVVAQLAKRLAAAEPLPPALGRSTPLRLMATYSDASGAFNPPPQPPSKRRRAADAAKRAASSSGGGELHESIEAAVARAGGGEASSALDFAVLLR